MDVWEFRFCMNSNSLSFVLNITYWKFVRTGRIQGARPAGDRSILAYVRIPAQTGNAVDCRSAPSPRRFVRTGRIQGARLAGDRSILAYVRIPDQAGNAVDCRFSQTGIEIPASLLQQIQHQLKPIPPHIIRVRNIIKS